MKFILELLSKFLTWLKIKPMKQIYKERVQTLSRLYSKTINATFLEDIKHGISNDPHLKFYEDENAIESKITDDNTISLTLMGNSYFMVFIGSELKASKVVLGYYLYQKFYNMEDGIIANKLLGSFFIYKDAYDQIKISNNKDKIFDSEQNATHQPIAELLLDSLYKE
jgi:ferredoxin-NADP reductase